MGLFVFFLVPETKGRTLEGMDEVFGSAYGELVGGVVEFRRFQRERGVDLGRVKGRDAGADGDVESGIKGVCRDGGIEVVRGEDEITRVATLQVVPMASL